MPSRTPTVELIASTKFHDQNFDQLKFYEEPYTCDSDALAEVAGRSCYESYTRPNSKTRRNRDYLKHIIELEHNSVLEHASATFYITGVSRSLLTELTRHRHLSFSVLSQRYVDSSDSGFVVPPAVRGTIAEGALQSVHESATQLYEALVADLTERGIKRKQAREAARAVLPGMTETKIIVTGNLAAWRYVLRRRLDPSADAEIREVAALILEQLTAIAPGTFQDFE